MSLNNTESEQGNNLLFYGLLVYAGIFYSQIGGRLAFLEAFRVELLVGSVLMSVAIFHLISGKISFQENKFHLAAFTFIFVISLSIPFALVKTRALETSIQIYKFFAIYLLIIAFIKSEQDLKKFIFFYMAMISLIFVQPFFLSLQGKGFVYNNHMMRLAGVTGYFAHPNQLGMVTSTNLPFFYYFCFYFRSKLLKFICIMHIIIGLRVIMLTQSRTAMLGVITFFFMVWYFSSKKVVIIICLILALPVLWHFTPDATKERFMTLKNSIAVMAGGREAIEDLQTEEGPRLGSLLSRWTLMQHSFAAFMEHPIYGVGMGCFISYSGQRWGSWFPPHNTYAQALAELGLIGILSLGFVVFTTWKNLSIAYKSVEDKKADHEFLLRLAQALKSYYAIYLLVSFFGIEFFSNFWWLAGGLSVVILRFCPPRENSPSGQSR